MVHPDQGLVPQQAEHARGHDDTLQWGTHPRTLGEADTVHIIDRHMSLLERLLHELDHPRAMMPRRVLGQEPLAWWGNVGVSNVGEDLGRAAILGMQHDANTKLVGGAFHANGDHDGRREETVTDYNKGL